MDILHTKEPQPEWKKLFDSVEPTTELQHVKQRIYCEKRKYLVGHKKVVIYLEDKYNPEVNAFIAKYYDMITRKFERKGFTFIYAPKEIEKIVKEYATPKCNVEWNAEILLDLFNCRIHEPIDSAIVLIDDNLNYRYAFPEQPIISTLVGIRLDAGTEEGLMAIFKAYWNRLRDDYCTSPMVSPSMDIGYEDACEVLTFELFTNDVKRTQTQRDEELKLKREIKIAEETTKNQSIPAQEQAYSSTTEHFTEEDEQLLREIQERIERLHHSGIRQQLIEQMVRMTVKPSTLQVTNDARLLLTNYGKEVKMLPIDKLVYIFFLRHPEGVALKDLADHKEEFTKLYERILGKRLTQKQAASIERLCNPLDNSINEKLSRIRQAFRAVTHDSVANCYIIQGERGEQRNITLSEELIELGIWGK